MKRFLTIASMLLLVITAAVPVAAADKARMNVSSVTLVQGESYQLKTFAGEKAKKASSWSSTKPSVASVSSSGKVTAKAKGSAYIRAKVGGKKVECLVSVVDRTDTDSVRYSVLIMDTSGSMKGSPLKYSKKAGEAFINTVLSADGRNYAALITLGNKAGTVCEFTNNKTPVIKKIRELKASGHTNMEDALAAAGRLLKQVPDGSKITKNIVLLSDGLPQTGKKQAKGRYKKSQHKDYKFANAAYKTDVKLKKKYFVYALGFFHDLEKKDLKFGKRLMKDLASTDKYYIIKDQKEITKAMNDVADVISTVTINKKEITLYIGETDQLVLSAGDRKKSGTWTSADSAVAAVSGTGLVKGVKAGRTTVTGTYRGEKCTCTVTVKNPSVKVIFNANGGKADAESKTAVYTEAYGKLPGAERKGYTFTGWYTKQDGGTVVTDQTKVTLLTDHTLFAHWKVKPHRYKVYHTAGLTWEQASAKCKEAGGYLACINSEEEQKTIEQLITGAKLNSYWIGGLKKDSKWRWEDGSELTYENWDDSYGEGSGSEPCMAIVGIPRPDTGKEFGEWLDTYNEGEGSEYDAYYKLENFGYICEWNE